MNYELIEKKYQLESAKIDRDTDWLSVFDDAEQVVVRLIKEHLIAYRELERDCTSELVRVRSARYDSDSKIVLEELYKGFFYPKIEHELDEIERLYRHYWKHHQTEKHKQNSNRFTDQEIEAVRNVPINEVFSREGIEVRHSFGKYIASCPFHEEKTPSCVLFDDNHFHCFGCSKRGNSIDFIQKYKNLSFREAVSYLQGSI